MTVHVVVPGQAEPWVVSNPAFKILADATGAQLPDALALDLLAAAESHGALFIGEIAEPTRSQLVEAMASAARTLRVELAGGDDWERSLAEHLPTLEMWLEGLLAE